MPNVATNLASEVRDGRKDAPGEQLAFDLCKPELDLIQPGRVGRSEMELDVRMIEEKRSDGLGLVGRQVIGDHMNLPPLRLRGDDLAEEFDKRGAGVPGHGLPEDLTR